jgi:hypothetical protein
MAIASFVLGILSILSYPSILAITFGIIALSQIKKPQESIKSQAGHSPLLD